MLAMLVDEPPCLTLVFYCLPLHYPCSGFVSLMDCFSLEEDEGLSFSIGADESPNNHEQLDTVFEEETQINSSHSITVSNTCH